MKGDPTDPQRANKNSICRKIARLLHEGSLLLWYGRELLIKRRGYGVLRSSAERPKGLLEIGLIASDTKIIRWGMHGTFLEGIMIGVGKVTSSRGEIVRMTYYFGDGRMSIIETGRIEHR